MTTVARWWCSSSGGPGAALAAFLPTEKALVERLKDRPFVLLGVNSDKDRAALKSASTEKGITWRSWFDGGSHFGPIASRLERLWLADDCGHRQGRRHSFQDTLTTPRNR